VGGLEFIKWEGHRLSFPFKQCVEQNERNTFLLLHRKVNITHTWLSTVMIHNNCSDGWMWK